MGDHAKPSMDPPIDDLAQEVDVEIAVHLLSGEPLATISATAHWTGKDVRMTLERWLPRGQAVRALFCDHVILDHWRESHTLAQIGFTDNRILLGAKLKELPNNALKSYFGNAVTDLKYRGYLASDLREGGYCVADLRRAGYVISDLREAGYPIADLINERCKLSELSAGCVCNLAVTSLWKQGKPCRHCCMDLESLACTGYSFDDLRRVGF